MTDTKWIFIETLPSSVGVWCDVYESEDGKLCKNVYSDGTEEIFEKA